MVGFIPQWGRPWRGLYVQGPVTQPGAIPTS